MTTVPLQRDIGAYVSNRIALGPITVVTDDANDGTEIDGLNFDRQSFTNESEPPLSAVLVLPWALLGATTLADSWDIDVQLQSGATTTAFADVAFKDGSTVSNNTIIYDSDDAAFALEGQISVKVNLGPLGRFVRCQVTSSFTGTTATTKSLAVGAIWVTGGSNIIPAA